MNISNNLKIIIKHFKNKEFQDVIFVCEKILKIKKDMPEIYNFYGLALQNQKKNKQAINYFNKAISLNSNYQTAFNNLANSYKYLFKYKYACKNFERCLEINPLYLPAIINFAVLKNELNDYEGSIELFKTALKIKPNDESKILFSLAEIYIQNGEIENSKKILKKILKLDRSNSAAHYMLSKLINYKDENDHYIEMENLLKNQNIKKNDTINFSFALGKVFEDKKDYKKSYNFYKVANDLKNQLFKDNLNYFNNLKTDLINFFEEFNISKIKNYKDKKIIFICGMPQSGTTLVEQIISSHGKVEASGETSILSNIFVNKLSSKLKNDKEKVKDFILTEGYSLQEYYYQRLDNLNINSQIITNKNVQNFIWIGFIRSLFPNSKIINCSRNSRDVCLSIYKNNFNDTFISWGYKQEYIANFHNFYFNLMEYWNNKFHNEIYNLNYEDLLNNPTSEIKRLISACDLTWDPGCINFQSNKSLAKTSNNIQVRKLLYNSSKDLSKNYTKYLSPMFGLLRN